MDRGGPCVVLIVGLDNGDDPDGVVAPIHAHQQRGGRQLPGASQHAVKKRRGPFLTVLAARAQFQLQAVALLPQIGRHRGVAVHPLVGMLDAFLLRLGVVEGGDVTVQRHPAVAKRCQACLTAAQKLNGHRLHCRLVARCMGIHALAQDALGGRLRQTQRLGDIGILPEAVDGLEVALAQVEQRNIARQNVAVRRRDGRRIHRQIGAFIQRHANETETRAGGEIRRGFSDDEPPQRNTRRVSLKMPPFFTDPAVS